MLSRILMVLACLAIPVVWGIVVNWAFGFWRERQKNPDENPSTIFPDYQI